MNVTYHATDKVEEDYTGIGKIASEFHFLKITSNGSKLDHTGGSIGRKKKAKWGEERESPMPRCSKFTSDVMNQRRTEKQRGHTTILRKNDQWQYIKLGLYGLRTVQRDGKCREKNQTSTTLLRVAETAIKAEILRSVPGQDLGNPLTKEKAE